MAAVLAGKSRQALVLFCLSFLGLNLNSFTQNFAGVPSAASQSQSSFRLRVDVDLATIEVIALDSKGRPMRDLKKEDFQLYEDGKKQEILSFDAVNGESGTSSLETSPIIEDTQHPGKVVLIVFDDSTITSENTRKARDSAARFVREHMQPQDLFAVASFGSSMKVLQNFTTDREEVLAAIGQPAASIPAGRFYFAELLGSLEKSNYSIAHLKGQKLVLIYCEGAYKARSIETVDTSGSGFRSDVRFLNSAKRSNVMYYTVDPGTTTGGLSVVSTEYNRERYQQDALINRQSINPSSTGMMTLEPLGSLAAESGGFSISNTNNLDAELDKLGQQISNYYILGFQSDNPKHDGAFRKLEVKTKLKGLTLRYRHGYLDRRPMDALASTKQEKVLLTALASPRASTQLPIVFRPAYFYNSPRMAKVLVVARIRMEKIAFKKKGGQLGTDLNIMGVAYAEDGSIAARFSEALPVSFDKEKEPEFRKANLAYTNYFKLRPGKYRLKLAVSDESNNLGLMEQALEVPPFPEKGFAVSSLVLAEQKSRLPVLIQNLQTEMLDESDPLLYSGVEIEPGVENRLPVNSAVSILFRIYNLPSRSDQWDLIAKPKLIDEKGKELALDPIPLKKALFPAGGGEAVVELGLSLQGIAPGKYRLIIEITEAVSTLITTMQTDLELVK